MSLNDLAVNKYKLDGLVLCIHFSTTHILNHMTCYKFATKIRAVSISNTFLHSLEFLNLVSSSLFIIYRIFYLQRCRYGPKSSDITYS